MPARLRATLVLLLLSSFPSASEARQGGPASHARTSRVAGAVTSARDAALEQLWFARKADLEAGDTAAAASKIEDMQRLVRAERLERVGWIARGFAYEGYEHLREGNYERAREVFDIARRFDPRLAEAQTGYAWAALRAGRGVGIFVKEYRQALSLTWQAFRREGAANVFLIGLAVLWFAAAVVVTVLVLRYQAMLRHDVGELLPARWSEGAATLAGWMVLLAPLLAWFGGVWLILYWCVVLARYMSGGERALAAAACLAVIVTGPLAERGAVAAETSDNPMVVAVESALQGAGGVEVIGELQRAATPEDVPLRLLLAATYERANLHREAFEEYQGVLRIHHDEARALNNIGNLYLRTGQTQQAIVYYTRAAEADPRRALFFHNLALAQSEALRLADAEASIEKVQELDPDLARTLVNARGRGEETAPLTASPSPDEVWAEVSARVRAAPSKMTDHLRSPTVMGALGAMLLLGWAGLSRAPMRAQTCLRCGEPFCGRCKKELGAKDCCAQCIHLFVKRDAIAPEVRAQKMGQVERFGRVWRRRVRMATLLMPGAGHLLAGRTLMGVVILMAWLAPLTAIALGRLLVMPPSLPVLDLPAVTTLVTLGFMAALWSTANIFIPRPPA